MNIRVFAMHAINTAFNHIIIIKSYRNYCYHKTKKTTWFPYCCISITSDKLHQRLPAVGLQSRQSKNASPTQCNGVIFSWETLAWESKKNSFIRGCFDRSQRRRIRVAYTFLELGIGSSLSRVEKEKAVVSVQTTVLYSRDRIAVKAVPHLRSLVSVVHAFGAIYIS